MNNHIAWLLLFWLPAPLLAQELKEIQELKAAYVENGMAIRSYDITVKKNMFWVPNGPSDAGSIDERIEFRLILNRSQRRCLYVRHRSREFEKQYPDSHEWKVCAFGDGVSNTWLKLGDQNRRVRNCHFEQFCDEAKIPCVELVGLCTFPCEGIATLEQLGGELQGTDGYSMRTLPDGMRVVTRNTKNEQGEPREAIWHYDPTTLMPVFFSFQMPKWPTVIYRMHHKEIDGVFVPDMIDVTEGSVSTTDYDGILEGQGKVTLAWTQFNPPSLEIPSLELFDGKAENWEAFLSGKELTQRK